MVARQTQEIEYRNGDDAFRVVLTSNSPDIFSQAAKQQEIKDKEGEALVAALLSYAKGAVFRVERYKDGKLNDRPGGGHAVQEFNDSGALIAASRYRDGKRQDAANGEPAFQKFNDDGIRTYLVHYKDDKRHDGPNGEPAEQVSDPSGNFVFIARYRDDNQIKVFTPQEMAEFQAKNAPAAPKTRKEPKSPGR